MKDLFFDPEAHRYYYQGSPVPCVSDILRPIDSLTMGNIPPYILEAAADRGTRVHEATMDYDMDVLDEDDVDEDIAPYIDAYKKFAAEYPSLPTEFETPYFSEVTGVAGTLDMVKRIDGKKAIIDKKTSKTLSRLRCIIQLNIYRINYNAIHPESPVEALYILQLKDTGKYRLMPIPIDEDTAFKYIALYKEIKEDTKL